MKRLLLILLIIACVQSLLPQNRISGKVTDKKSSPISGANVYIKDSYDGNTTGSDGKFSFITSENGEHIIAVSFIGYKTIEQKVNIVEKHLEVNFILEETASQLKQVVISAGAFVASDENKSVILRPLDITTTGASADIYSTLNTLPGTQQIGETEGLFVRGGTWLIR